MLSINDLKLLFKQQLTGLYMQYACLPESMRNEFNNLTEDFALHAIASLINDWYQKSSEVRKPSDNSDGQDRREKQIAGKPLNAYLKDIAGGDVDESTAQMLYRSSKKLRRINEQYRKTNREQGYPVPETHTPVSKREGIPLSAANMQTIINFSSMGNAAELLNYIISGRIKNSKSVSSESFARCFEDYEKFVAEIKSDLPDKEYVARMIDFYALQRKLHIDLIAEMAQFMDVNNISEFPTDCADCFWSTINTGSSLIEASQVLTYNKMIPVLFSNDLDYLESQKDLWTILRFAQSDLTKEFIGFECKFTVEFAADFFRNHYNMITHRVPTDFGKPENPNKRRIKLARKIMKLVYPEPEMKTNETTIEEPPAT